jgi:glycosyltransferase involved in cell wall biosynthesis
MKILHTNFHRGWGGQSNRILIVCRELCSLGHDVTIAAPPGSKLLEKAEKKGIKCFDGANFTRGFRPFKVYRDVHALREHIKKENFDIIHTHGSQDSWATAYALVRIKPRPPVFRTKHNIFLIKDHLPNKWLYGKATDRIVCISRAIYEYCAAKSYIKESSLDIIHSAVNAEKYSCGNGMRIRKEFNLEGKFVTGISGRLRQEKGHTYLFQALSKIKDQAQDLVLLAIGDGSMFAELKELAEKLQITDRVIFTGFRKDVPDILASLELFIMPSISEGLGTAVLEAGAAGLPIIASDVGGIPDIIENGVSGILTPPGEPAPLSEAIMTLYNNRDLAEKYSRKAKEWVTMNFSEKALGEKTEAFYKRTLKMFA